MNKIFIPMMAVLATTALTSPLLADTREMSLDSFSKIKVFAPVDLDVSVGKKPSFSIEGREEDLNKIIIEVKNDTLIIKKEKRSGRTKKVMVTLSTKDLDKFIVNGSSDAKIRNVNSKDFKLGINGSGDVMIDGKSDELEIEINGSGDVESRQFNAPVISAEINGSGDISLAGKCNSLKVSISGSGEYSGRNMICSDVKAGISGSGDATVYANKSVRISTSGSSDVNVYGNPKSIKNSSSGSSDLIVHDEK